MKIKYTLINEKTPKHQKRSLNRNVRWFYSNSNWIEEFDKRINPQGKEYYWLTGKFINLDKGEDTDIAALDQDYVSVVPVKFDLTAHHFLQNLNAWF